MAVDVLVVGAGAVGLTTALELHRAGLRVCVVDKQQPGQESSWAGGGILSPLYPWRYPDEVTRLAVLGQQRYQGLIEGLARDTLTDPEFRRSGFLSLGVDDAVAALEWAASYAARIEFPEPAALRALVPGLGERLRGPLDAEQANVYLPDVGQVRTPRLSRALYQYLSAQGVEFVLGSQVLGLEVSGARVRGVRCVDGRYQAGTVVVCAGAWTSNLVDGLGPQSGIRPIKGQMLLFRAQPGLLQRIVIADGYYLIPRSDGRILIGSTLEDAGFDKTVSGPARRSLRDVATDMLPALADVPLEHHWAGLRPGRAGDVPIVSAHPQVEGLYVNAGHYRNGVVLAPGSAQLMAALLTQQPPPVDPAPYRLQALDKALVV